MASDVANVLGYRMASDATRILEEDEVHTHNIRTKNGIRKFNIVNESGLYSMIFTSRKPEAKSFKNGSLLTCCLQLEKLADMVNKST